MGKSSTIQRRDKPVQSRTLPIMENVNLRYVDSLLERIEDKLQWGESSQWSSYDFDKLATLILDSTKIAISSNTLKRVWGRIKYDSNPSDMTLNTFSQFIGYKDFREFISKSDVKETISPLKTVKKSWFKWPPFQSRPSIIFATGAVFMLVAIIALSYSTIERKYNPDDFYFTSRKVAKGLPNSVVFEYRASNAPASAKLEIQQSWDESKRMSISREDSLATSIYFDPGYFKSKLVVDGQVVKEHGVLIPSEGWKGKVESGKKALYFKDSSVIRANKVTIDAGLLSANGIDENTVPVKTIFRYVDDFKDLRVNDLFIETELKNTLENSFNMCRNSSITLLMEGEAIKIPLSNMGCISELELWHLDRVSSGKNNDLSSRGVNFEGSVKVGFAINKDLLTVSIDGRKAIELSMKGRINKFHGLIYRFEGTGEISSLIVKNSKKTYLQWPTISESNAIQ